MMKISNIRIQQKGWQLFNLNVGGFCIRNCRWHPVTRAVWFPVRYPRNSRTPQDVVFAHGSLVKRLQKLLESGLTQTPRDRRPCVLKIGKCGISREMNADNTRQTTWVIFNFTVRGFTILRSRWHPESGSIQLPVTFKSTWTKRAGSRYRKMPCVCAFGSHINRLRTALELACPDLVIRRAA